MDRISQPPMLCEFLAKQQTDNNYQLKLIVIQDLSQCRWLFLLMYVQIPFAVLWPNRMIVF